MTIVADKPLTHREVEDFLFHEAELLDDWQLLEWADLYTEESVYEIASLNSSTPAVDDPKDTLFLVADRIDRIRGRASRLLKPTAHAEYPRSKTRHMVSNVRMKDSNGDDVQVRANFVIFRTKEDTTTSYMGEYRYLLRRVDGEIRIIRKRVILDLNSLYDQGRLTIIL